MNMAFDVLVFKTEAAPTLGFQYIAELIKNN